MSKRSFTRREILTLGAQLTGAAVLGSQFPAGKLLGNIIREDAPVFDVMKYGAKGNGSTIDTKAIQNAIDAAAKVGNGARVLVPSGYKFLTGSLVLKSDIDFHLDGDAELLGSPNKTDYDGPTLITAQEVKGLRISGTGNVNGQALKFMDHYDKEYEWWRPKDWRPGLFKFIKCTDLEISDITASHSPQFTFNILGCEKVLVHDIKIDNDLKVPNCDGIDPSNSRNVEIRNCHIVCGDDAIAIHSVSAQNKDYGPTAQITVRDCFIKTQDCGLKIGSGTGHDIHDILFERCTISQSSRGLGIQLRDEGDVYNIVFRDITFVSQYFSDPWWGRGEAISLTAIPRTADTKVGSIHDIRIKNVKGRAENSIRINGTEESRISNIILEDISVTFDRWTSWPGGLFDNRPTKIYSGLEEVFSAIEYHDNPGISICYADGVLLKNCNIKWGNNKPDYFTNAVEASHVTDLKIAGFDGESAHPDRFAAIHIK
jgi:polygalacturonase